jgi:hypothetical protein
MVDVDDRGMRGDALHTAARPLEVAGVEEEHEMRVDAVGRLFLDLAEARKERVHLRQRRRDQHPHLLPGGAQGLGKCEAAAEGVPVCILVAEDQDVVVCVEELLDLVVEVRRPGLGGYVASSSPCSETGAAGAAGSTSLSSSAI